MARKDTVLEPPGRDDKITRLLVATVEGDGHAFDRLIPLIYDDLRRIAHGRLRSERVDHTLNTTAVVHEAYLQLANHGGVDWQDRTHFFAVAARVIRHVLIDYGRARGAEKRGGSAIRIPLHEDIAGRAPRTIELLALDDALTELARLDPVLGRVVECRFFGGMSMRDTAAALDLSLRAAERHWTRARAYLFHMLEDRDV